MRRNDALEISGSKFRREFPRESAELTKSRTQQRQTFKRGTILDLRFEEFSPTTQAGGDGFAKSLDDPAVRDRAWLDGGGAVARAGLVAATLCQGRARTRRGDAGLLFARPARE